jgi:hypothetical protein
MIIIDGSPAIIDKSRIGNQIEPAVLPLYENYALIGSSPRPLVSFA